MKRAAILLFLAGCAALPQTASNPRQFVPDGDGLAVLPDAMRVDFGRAPSGVILALTRERGAPRDLGLANCPGGIVQQLAWGDLTLTFTDERFVGWKQGEGSAGTVCE